MENSYKGFYCSICDYSNHKFFDTQNQTVTFSEKFCRDIVENSLTNLLFWHIHLHKYSNLVSKFLLSCDLKGNFQPDVKIPEEILFIEDEHVGKSLRDCRSERNTQHWFTYCRNVCRQFKINEFNDYFEPDLDKIEDFSDFIKKQVTTIRHGGKGIGIIDEITSGNSRILQAELRRSRKTNKRHKKKSRSLKKSVDTSIAKHHQKFHSDQDLENP